ncbi:hypothetical protein EW026_g806 [Hermanssonia centrifuga]|uniref:S-adenosyl-L-methionine-dependent methyltransferase n=1 Tax=Hermanssonia centrifuga TaxID=98765 RepID=A0A4S4KV90_9APHY|nr:hypothetical protein EW026_g806 [Hermanssonia centrifuga]
MAHVWTLFGNPTDENGRDVKNILLSNATGVVIDIGAGHGHTVNYLDRQKVTKYIALEPNTLMHDEIRKRSTTAGFTEASGTLQILSYGAEDISLIVSALEKPQSVDTLVSILTLCTIPAPAITTRALVDQVLKPGGQFLFYEHVLSPREDVARWQRFWTPIWRRAFDGCCLDRPTHLWLKEMNVWDSKEFWGKEGEEEENLFWHQVGKLIKAPQAS